MSVKEQMTHARQLIGEKRYAEARAILQQLDHPIAQEWLQKLDDIAPQQNDDIFASDRAKPTENSILHEYGFSKFEAFRRLLLGILLIGLGIAMIFLLREDTDTDNSIGTWLILILLDVGWFFFGFWLTIPSLMAILGGRKTIISSQGISRQSLTGVKHFDWQEIETYKGGLTRLIYSGIPLFTYGAYSFYSQGKVAFQISNLDASPYDICDLIVRQIIAHQTDPLVARFRMGETLKFNTLSVKVEIQQDGLHSGNKVLPMNEFGEAGVQGDNVHIVRKNGKTWKRFRISDMDSPWLFVEVVNAIVGRP